jgi:hypothetical protein
MSFFKKPFRKLKELNANLSGNDSSEDTVTGKEAGILGTPRRSTSKFTDGVTDPSIRSSPDPRRRSRDLIQEEKQRRSMDKERLKTEQKKKQQLARIASDTFMMEGPQDLIDLYRPFSMNMSKRWNHENRKLFKELDFASQ